MKYANQIGDAQFPPPYQFPDVTILSFTLEADLTALKALCDSVLNVGAFEDRGFEYRPVLPFVDLEILNYPKMEHGRGDPRAVGVAAEALSLDYTDQQECYVRLFVMKYVSIGGWPVPDGELAVFCPFLLVNNTWSAISGRDVMGFPKLFGTFHPSVEEFLADLRGDATAPRALDPRTLDSGQIHQLQQALGGHGFSCDPDGIWGPQTQTALDEFEKSKGIRPTGGIDPSAITALGLDPKRFAGQATVNTLAFEKGQPKARLLPVVTIKKSTDGAQARATDTEPPAWPWKNIDSRITRYAGSLSPDHFRYDESIMPSVQMKEFRDAENPANACYQAIIGSCIFVESIDQDNSGLLPPVEVTITDYENLQLAAALGIPAGKPLAPVWQHYFKCSFKFDDARTLFVNSDAGGYDPGGFWSLFWPPWVQRPE